MATSAKRTPASKRKARPAKPTHLVLIRHAVTAETGRTLSGRTLGIDLSKEGRAQAAALGRNLAGLPVDVVYSSPLERTRQTAEAVARHHGLEVRELPDVVDFDVGEWTGKPLGDLAKQDLWRVIQAAPSRAVFPGGEGLAGMQARAVAALDGVLARHAGEVVVVASHADVIKAAVAHYIGLHLDQFQRLVVAPASVSVLTFSGPFPALVTFNDTGSINGWAPSRRRTPAGAKRGTKKRP